MAPSIVCACESVAAGAMEKAGEQAKWRTCGANPLAPNSELRPLIRPQSAFWHIRYIKLLMDCMVIAHTFVYLTSKARIAEYDNSALILKLSQYSLHGFYSSIHE